MPPTTSGKPATRARVCTLASFPAAFVALGYLPIVFGTAAVVLAVVGYSSGDRRLGKWAIEAAAAGLVLGLVLEYLAQPS